MRGASFSLLPCFNIKLYVKMCKGGCLQQSRDSWILSNASGLFVLLPGKFNFLGRCLKKLKIKLSKNYWSISIAYIDFKLISVPIHPIRNGSPNWWQFVMDRDYPSPFVSSQHVVLHTYMNICGVIILEQGILIQFFHLYICVICQSSLSVTNCHPFWQPITERVYCTFM